MAEQKNRLFTAAFVILCYASLSQSLYADDMPTIIVYKNDAGLSLLDFLHQRIPAAPLSYLRKMVKKGEISKQGHSLPETARVSAGEVIDLPDSARIKELIQLSPNLHILFESREILAVDKPAGLAVHSSRGHEADNLCERVNRLLSLRKDHFRAAPVHRLDLGTSGPILFGKGKQACRCLGQLFMQQNINKHYLALALGSTTERGILDSVLTAKDKPKRALTHFSTLAKYDQATLLELRLETGRQHQIRRQLAESGHPLYGDKRYRGPCPANLKRLFLHCFRLSFDDPFRQVRVELESPLPVELAAFLQTLGDAELHQKGKDLMHEKAGFIP